MVQKPTQTRQLANSGLKAALALGGLLILAGLVLLYAVLFELYGVWQSGSQSPFDTVFIQAVAQPLQASDLLVYGDQPLHLTRQGALVLAFVLLLLFAWLAVGAALQLVRHGVALVLSVMSRQRTAPASRERTEEKADSETEKPSFFLKINDD